MTTEIYASPSHEQTEAIAGNVRLISGELTDLTGKSLPPGRAGVVFLDGFIERQREHGDKAHHAQLADMAGCYLGAALLAEAGGRWVQDPKRGPAVELAPSFVAYPFAKAAKQFANGREAGGSVLSFFDASVSLAADARLRATFGKAEPPTSDP